MPRATRTRLQRALACAATFGATTFVTVQTSAAPAVWVIDDGEKVKADATETAFERGEDNPVWKPGDAVRLFAMRNESVAVQVVVEADPISTAGLSGVTVDLDALDGAGDAPPARRATRRHRRAGSPARGPTRTPGWGPCLTRSSRWKARHRGGPIPCTSPPAATGSSGSI
jgi:hypothetical protein